MYVDGYEGTCNCGRYARKNAKYDPETETLLCGQCYAKMNRNNRTKCFSCDRCPTKLYELEGKKVCCVCNIKYSRPKNLPKFRLMINNADIQEPASN